LASACCVLGAFASAPSAVAQEAAPPESDFEVRTLAKGSEKTGEPIAMAVLPDRRVLHTSRDGRVWLTTPNATTSLAATIPVYSHDEDGLQGIAIDDDFETNRWVYLYYAPLLDTPAGDAPASAADPAAFEPFKGHNQLSRIKLTDAGTLDLATEQKILQVPADRGICCHAGGEIDFDAQGNLYLSTGDDSNPFESDGYTPIDERATRNPAFDAQRSSANTNDLRGKLLRISVNADGSYSIPEGNLFAPGTMGTRPEVYAMGFRNPFRFAVDDQTGWVYLGDYGPDAGGPDPDRGPGGQVEFNLIKGPGNYGWPYCHGKNDAYNDFDFATRVSGAKFTCAAPRNESPRNTGLTELPPAQPAWIAYDNCSIPEFGCGSESPMGGETYRYDPANPSTTKLPAYYDGKNFAYEFGRGWIRVFDVGADGSLQGIEPFMDGFDFKQLINAQFGPDGSYYVLDYGTGFFSGDANSALYRIDYVQGTRSPVAEASADRTSGPAPLAVQFSSAGSRDPDGGPIAYAWDFDNDGTVDSTAANPAHTYTTAGRYTASLEVTDEAGQKGNASINVVAGNTAPTVTIELPADGAMFDYGDSVPYRIEVTDPEDATIDCARVRLDTSLGHNEHSHGDQSLPGCEGRVTIPAAWEDKTQQSFYVLTASYTDTGGTTPGLELTGTAEVILEPKEQQAEFFDAQSGLQIVDHEGAAGGRRVGYVDVGDWLRFDDINLTGIDSVQARLSAWNGSGFELRADSPTGQLLASVPVSSTGSGDTYQTQPAVPVTDPGRTFDLYVVFTGASMDLDALLFLGAGVTGNASPVLEAAAQPLSGAVPLTVDFSAQATDPEGTDVALKWDFGVAGAPQPTTGAASYTYTERGFYTATVTATDADGRKVVRAFRIEALADCSGGPRAPGDEFDGTALDVCRWSTILREEPSRYRVEEGKLEIDALDGDMHGGNTSARNVVLQPAPDGGWEAITKVALPQGEEFEQAGLIAHSSDQDFAKLVLIDVPNVGWRVEFGQTLDGQPIFSETLDRSNALPAGISDSGIYLKLRSDGASLTAAWSADGETWTALPRARSLAAMPDLRIGLAAYNGNGQPAAFDFFRLEQIDVEPPCQTGATPDEGYRMLFDGTATSLSQWKMAGPGGFALQPDCSILSFGGLGLLYHPDAFESYSLKLDWKMAGDDNSGVFVGFKDPGTDPFNAVNQGHEIQIDATDDADSTTGAIYNVQAADTAARDAVLNPPGEWNAYEIVVQGDRIQVFLNGTKINDYTDTDPNRMNAPSLVGLQNHGAEDDVFFRDVQIKEIETPSTPPPTLELTSPTQGEMIDGDSVTVAGTTNGTSLQIRVGTTVRLIEPQDGAFSATVPVQLGSNRINVTAYNAQGVPTATSVTVVSRAFGTLVGGFADPAGDDNGPGTYVYPTNSAFADGGFDLTRMEVYSDGDSVRFVTQINGEIVNPWGGDQISHQRINVYVGAGTGDPVAALPGTNMDTASPWSAAVVIDGRFNTAGVFAPDGTKLSGGTLSTLPQTREIIITVPRSAFGALDLESARYGTAMFGNAEAGEGIGYVRPVYDLAYWQNPGPDFWWITEYRFGGGAGVWTDAANHDSDTRDPNAIDVIVGPGQTQAQVLDWQAGSPTRVPMLATEQPDTTAPTVSARLAPADPDGADGWYRSPVEATVEAEDDRPGALELSYRLDGGQWTAYAAPLAVVEDGEHTLEYRATDAAGNESEVGSVRFRVDGTGPDVTVSGVQDGATYGDSTTRTVSWTATDPVSGPAGTAATLDGESIASGATIRLWELTLGEHALVVTSTDKAGNATVRHVTFTVSTSLADLKALVDRFRADGRIGKGGAAALYGQIAEAQKALAAGDTDAAVASLEQVVKLAGIHVKDRSARAVLQRDARALIAALEG
jgi:glucose/arabinose dehydrogenase/PKD repeat protein